MNAPLFYLVTEDVWNQAQTARQLVGLCHSLMCSMTNGAMLTIRADEMSALLDCIEQNLEPLNHCRFQRVENITSN